VSTLDGMRDLLLGVTTADVPLTPENVRPGWLAMLVVGVLIVALVILMRSFIKHFRRASEPWEGEERDDPPS
jgi:RsiW-degrading membrane proteinase PrsW (M82 family)